MMELIVVAGMSGAGKTSAAEALEDIGYSVMDGLPLPLLRTLVPECLNKGGVYERLAAVADLRSCESYSELTDTVKAMKAEYSGKVRVRLLCMEAAADVIMKRFRLQRRLHPLQNRFEGDLAAAIAYEQTHLQPIRGAADHLVDTSQILSPYPPAPFPSRGRGRSKKRGCAPLHFSGRRGTLYPKGKDDSSVRWGTLYPKGTGRRPNYIWVRGSEASPRFWPTT